MKFMKLGGRPDTFFSPSEFARSVYTEVTTDLQILVGNCLYHLHKFPLLSKCLLLQALCAEPGSGGDGEVIELAGFPGGAEAFEACAKFCYGITITVSARNLVPLRCAAAHLGMSEAADRGNLAAKLDSFLASCLLRRWKDALAVLHSTRHGAPLCEELGLTSRCVDAVAVLIASPANAMPAKSTSASPWWAHDVAELGVDMFWRIMVAVKSTGAVHEKTVGDALKAYARRWLPNVAKDAEQPFDDAGAIAAADDSVKQVTTRHRLLLEKIVSLLPVDKDAVSCAFLLKLLKAANILSASAASKAELVRRVAWQLEEASVGDLLIPSVSCVSDMLYDVDAVAAILDEFALRHAAANAQPAQPPAAGSPDDDSPARSGGHRRSRSDESVGFDGARRSSSAAPVSQYALARVGRLVDTFLIEVSKDPNLPVDKLLAIAEAVPDSARPEHDGLYKVVDSYLKAHPEMSKSARKRLCRVLNCRKLSEKACSHAAQNELLPLRVVVQVLFFEHARAAALSGGPVSSDSDLPSNIKALLSSKSAGSEDDDADRVDEQRLRALASGASPGDDWSVEGLRRAASKIATLRMKMEEDEDDDDEFVRKAGLSRSASLRFRAFCALPTANPKRMLSKLWPLARSITADRH
ncbi:BTB/POZ domain-containing protein At1g67900-like [Lolium rigidum]|uniref:BTB/POZ domain-containing protein At1g67900-like n=1 Tax=Lolium rigidum TaxID=89674 RepID=UPI001F5CCB8B|nr:BTB/POZ domain-containing protein At1g67900-like [Lolium rigidum]XP_047077528.1 BTB/POZ domain-containing protein At1g67900-like [Lolium rigidum]